MTIPDRDLEYLISNYKNGFSFYDMAEVNKVYGCPSGKDISVMGDTLLWKTFKVFWRCKSNPTIKINKKKNWSLNDVYRIHI